MVEMREQFEKLPEIARVIACDEIKWCDTYHWYRTDNTDANSIYHVAWLNGAWYAFQEQQKKIDGALKELELLNYYRTGNSDNAIKILKGTDK